MSGPPLVDVVVPLNEEGTKATVLKWAKRVGETVRRDEPLLELETDKVTVEIPSPAGGELVEILKEPDEEVRPGEVLARVRVAAHAPAVGEAAPAPARAPDAPAHAPDAPAVDVQGSAGARALLSPAVRRLLADRRISPAQVRGTGRNGRITARDVLGHRPGAPGAGLERDTVVAHTPVRRRIAEHMARSLLQAPHVTTLFEADLSAVLAHRARAADGFAQRGVRLTLTAYFIAACARALRAHPRINSSFRDDGLALHADANIGIGTALGDDGLIVPVLHRAQELDLFGIAARLGQLVDGARAGTLAPGDVRGGTFTISNHGVGGSLLAAPIVIHQPQVAILGVGKVERRVCALTVGGADMIAVRSMCYLTLTIDHRALDAFQANAFLSDVVGGLEHWPAHDDGPSIPG